MPNLQWLGRKNALLEAVLAPFRMLEHGESMNMSPMLFPIRSKMRIRAAEVGGRKLK